MSWGRTLVQRMHGALDRLRATRPGIADSAPGTETLDFPADTWHHDYSRLPSTFPPGRTANRHGFIERNDLDRLYRVDIICTGNPGSPLQGAADPRRSGFKPDDVMELAAGRPALEGDVIDAYRTPEAAWQAFQLRCGNTAAPAQVEFHLFEISAGGLNAVSFGDNAINNPHYATLMRHDQHLDTLNDLGVGHYHTDFSSSKYRPLQDEMVQLQLDNDLLRTRTSLRETRLPN